MSERLTEEEVAEALALAADLQGTEWQRKHGGPFGTWAPGARLAALALLIWRRRGRWSDERRIGSLAWEVALRRRSLAWFLAFALSWR